MTTEKLKPCPFCGEAVDLRMHVYGDEAFVQCHECTTCGPDGADREGAALKWNHRPQAGDAATGEPVAWLYEDTLPDSYPYDEMFPHSQVRGGVRMFPVFLPTHPPASTGGGGGEVIEGHSTSACGPDRSADARDAARYRWLQHRVGANSRQSVFAFRAPSGLDMGALPMLPTGWRHGSIAQHFDAALDAAMGTVSPDRPMSDGKEPQS